VLDVGCGTGSITAGIAKAVGPQGHVVGIDRDPGLLELARQEHAGVANLRFEAGDATTLCQMAEYDFVTSARTLQWIPEPVLAIQNMKRALKPSGILVVLDYNHVHNAWVPEPPEEFKLFCVLSASLRKPVPIGISFLPAAAEPIFGRSSTAA
jgi:ubiquinone/menaquinone biosynthesis C-methylase UbiE